MTMTLPLRLMTLHFSQIGLTEGLTFILTTSQIYGYLFPISDPSSCEIIRGQLNDDSVSCQDPDKMHAQLAGYMSKDLVTVFQLYTKHRIWEGFDNRPFDFNNIFFGHSQSPF
jgi:hypothetical protein